MKLSDFTTFAKGNGLPCNGDVVEAVVDGERYRAEFYIEENFGKPCVMLAGDSSIERCENGEWKVVQIEDDDEFNFLLSKITPVLELD